MNLRQFLNYIKSKSTDLQGSCNGCEVCVKVFVRTNETDNETHLPNSTIDTYLVKLVANATIMKIDHSTYVLNNENK